MGDPDRWVEEDQSVVIRHLREENERTLDSYRVQPRYIREHAQIERSTAQGGYENRQLYELIQNGADALQDQVGSGRIEVVLTAGTLYCANQGEPLTVDGLETILGSHMSTKRGTEIGRFGLGFKSVLAVSNQPRFHTVSGSFEFDTKRSFEAIQSVVGTTEEAPTLRLGWPISTTERAETDPVLAELADWATTIIELPLDVPADQLAEDLRSFPAEFLLFSPHVATVRLNDLVNGRSRRLSTSRDGDTIVLDDGEETVPWRVFSTIVRPSEEARDSSGDRSDRSELPLSWAVPVTGAPKPGAFWAFFPTEYQSTLRGILNTPWKTTADRQNLQRALINEELLEAAATLVVDSLPRLSSADDPAGHLEAMPARLQDAKQWADQVLNQRVYELAAERPLVPDWGGTLVEPAALELLPESFGIAEAEIIGECGDSTSYGHPTVMTRTRHARARRLCNENVAEPGQVLTTLAEISLAGAASAILLLAALRSKLPERDHKHLARTCKIVPDGSGRLHPATANDVYLPSSGHEDLGLPTVNRITLESVGVAEALASLGVRPPSTQTAINSYLAERQPDWTKVWELISSLSADDCRDYMKSCDSAVVHVRTRDDRWRPADAVLLPGSTVGRSDPTFAVDTAFHANSRHALEALGISDCVTRRRPSRVNPYLEEFRREARVKFSRARNGSPQMGYIQFQQEGEVAGPIKPLVDGSEDLRLTLTEEFLPFCSLPGWRMTHSTRSAYYGYEIYGPPELWLVRRYGLLPTSLGPRPVSECVAGTLDRFGAFLPVTDIDQSVARALGLPTTPEEFEAQMRTVLLQRAETEFLNEPEVVASIYEFLAAGGAPRPSKMIIDGQKLRPEDVIVSHDAIVSKHLAQEGEHVLLVSASTEAILIEHWNLRPANEVVDETVQALDPATPEPLFDLYEGLRAHLPRQGLSVSRCAGIVRQVASHSALVEESLRLHLDGDCLLAVDDASDEEIIGYLDSTLDIGLPEDTIESIVEPVQNRRRQDLVERIASCESLESKLAEALSITQLQRSLSEELVASVHAGAPATAETLANVLLATQGTHVLRHLADELREAGLEPPSRWKGSAKAEEFVRSLGFPIAFAGSEERHRPEVERVPGAVSVPALHDYQEAVVAELRPVLQSENGGRALVSLPTGAGKTRVMVEGLIREMKSRPNALVLWIAQRDELCEQAVQAWTDLWRAMGPPDRDLTIGRLWGSRRVLPLDRPAVTVSTYQTLRRRVGKPDHAWLSDPDWVVIDEAHGATTPSYTQIRSELGLGGRDRERPLVGMTATPFRGTSERETADLARLFGRNLIDPFDGEGLSILQERDVLARADHELLNGVEIELSAAEEAHVERFSSLPESVEERLGRNTERNAEILKSVLALPDAWPVLLFASSVHQAEVLAAQLTIAGTPSQAISGTTDKSARRFAVDEFDRGGIRVLTNYAVLHQGFDAPSVRAVYICRPTFSPATYQQMVGRGLRGPLNGGSDRCLIVDIADNIDRFGGNLAFRSFEYLWSR